MNKATVQGFKERGEAEKLLISKDYAGARQHLLKARQLLPCSTQFDSMLTLCDILAAATIKLPGCGVDHYWVLQVIPSSSIPDIRLRYQKLVHLLQPLRKIYPCTDLALQLLLNAVTLLTDPKRRSEFDSKRNSTWENYAHFDMQASSCDTFSNEGTVTTGHSSSVSKVKEPQHFLTKSKSSNVEKVVRIPNLPMVTSMEGSLHSCSENTEQRRPVQDFYNFENDRKSDHFQADQIWAVHSGANLSHKYRYARIDLKTKAATCVSWLKPIPVTSSERRWCDAGLPVACGSFEVCMETQMNIEVRWPMIASYQCSLTCGATEEQFEIYPKRGEIWAVYKDWNLDDWSYNPDCVENCKFELVEIISQFSKYLGASGTCLVEVDGFNSIFKRLTIGGCPVTFHIPPNNLYIFSHKIPAYQFKGGELDKIVPGMFELDMLALPDYMLQDIGSRRTQSVFKAPPEDRFLNPSWSPKDFITGQIWAVYLGKDSMPRQYVRVNNVTSENQVSVTFLEPLPALDHEIKWMKNKLPISCGIFRLSGRTAKIEMPLFCHLVQFQENNNTCYRIYPRKGEVWAIYSGWNTKWKKSEYSSHQCLIAQILSDFSEGGDLTTGKMKRVDGYLTFFHRQQFDGFDLVSITDMLSFSHRIPAYRVAGIGKYGISESSWHLEPNALPFKLVNW